MGATGVATAAAMVKERVMATEATPAAERVEEIAVSEPAVETAAVSGEGTVLAEGTRAVTATAMMAESMAEVAEAAEAAGAVEAVEAGRIESRR